MLKKITFVAAFFLLSAGAALAEDDSKIAVVYLDGETEQSYAVSLAAMDRIELSGTTVNLYTMAGLSKSFEMGKVQKIDFHPSTDGISSANSTSGVIVRTSGYQITVEGLQNGAEVCAYDVAGKLVGKTVAKNGSAQLDATSFTGATIVKAAGKSIKFIKK